MTLSQKLILASDADLQYVAGQTEGFTGADLQALLVSAQMAAYDLELSGTCWRQLKNNHLGLTFFNKTSFQAAMCARG